MPEHKVDLRHFKMIADFYERKCPCWGGKHNCPCPPFAETQNCRCGAVLPSSVEPREGKKENYRLYNIDFDRLSEVINGGHSCVGDDSLTCFCDEFMENGVCKFNVFKRACPTG